jgi:hypothetical protein
MEHVCIYTCSSYQLPRPAPPLHTQYVKLKKNGAYAAPAARNAAAEYEVLIVLLIFRTDLKSTAVLVLFTDSRRPLN